MQHFIIRWRRPRKSAILPELNTYPETLSGFYPGSKLAEGFRVSFDIKIQLSPELNEYPSTIVQNIYPAWLTKPVKAGKTKFTLQSSPPLNVFHVFAPIPAWLDNQVKKIKVKTRFNIQSQPELNEYRQVGSPYPSWALHFEKTKDLTKRRLLTQPKLDRYTPTIFAGDYPTWLAKESFRTKFIRHHLRIQELNVYPAIAVSIAPLPSTILERSIRVESDNATRRKSISATVLRIVLGSPTFDVAIGVGFSTSMTNDGLSEIGLMFNDGIGATGTMTNDGIGKSSTMSNSGIGKVGLITNDGIGREGGI